VSTSRRRSSAASTGLVPKADPQTWRGDWTAPAARSAPRRLGVPICQPALSRRRRHRGRSPWRCTALAMERVPAPSGGKDFAVSLARRARVDFSACKARTAPGARSMPTTSFIISTIFRSPTTAPCSIRRRKTSPRALRVDAGAIRRDRRQTARRLRAPSIICAATSLAEWAAEGFGVGTGARSSTSTHLVGVVLR